MKTKKINKTKQQQYYQMNNTIDISIPLPYEHINMFIMQIFSIDIDLYTCKTHHHMFIYRKGLDWNSQYLTMQNIYHYIGQEVPPA